MKIWSMLPDMPGGERFVVTTGNSDGTHDGHRRVVPSCAERARERGTDAVATTFSPHPIQVHAPEAGLQPTFLLRDRPDAVAASGLDATLVVHYDTSVYVFGPEEFVVEFLAGRLGAVEVVVGEDFHFGRVNLGTVDTFRELGCRYGFDATMVTDTQTPEGRRQSSSWVRELLAEGDVVGAARVLGHLHRIRGTVEYGFERGHELGFPTANLQEGTEGAVPADGVYAGWVARQVPGTESAESLPSVVLVGTNPQFDDVKRTIEAHVLGRSDLNLYGERIAVVFASRIRPMLALDSLRDLLVQMDDGLRQSAYVLGVRVVLRIDPEDVIAR